MMGWYLPFPILSHVFSHLKSTLLLALMPLLKEKWEKKTCEGKNGREISDLSLLGSGQVLCGLFSGDRQASVYPRQNTNAMQKMTTRAMPLKSSLVKQ